MSSTNNNNSNKPLVDDVSDLLQLTELFCNNQALFYQHIATYNSVDNINDITADKPIVYKTIDNIPCIFSPNIHYSFYNAILNTDIVNTLNNTNNIEADDTIQNIIKYARKCKVPIRCSVSSNAIDTQKLLTKYHFLQFPSRSDSYQYIDLYNYDYNISLDYNNYIHSNNNNEYELFELTEQTYNVQQIKSIYGNCLSNSFNFKPIIKHQQFYTTVWSNVICDKSVIRWVIAKYKPTNEIIGGAHLSLQNGVAVIFNVCNIQKYRNKGLGTALSIWCIQQAKINNYRYILLQASPLGVAVYRKIGFKNLPPYSTFVKLSTAAYYCNIIEFILYHTSMKYYTKLMLIIQSPLYNIIIPLINILLLLYTFIILFVDIFY